MSASDWTELWERFHEALALPPEARDAWLDAHCTDPAVRAELGALLEAAGRSDTPLDRPAAGAEPLEPGTRIGPWAVVDLLGRGGMGEVYRVERADGRFEKRAALKLLAASLGDDAFRARFERERRILAGLDHPNIARLIDAGRAEDGRPWLLMDLVDGCPITEAAAADGWPHSKRLQTFVEVCNAVAYAHRRLIVHRDLKPANLLVDADGRPMLLDFGIARLLENSAEPGLTRAGQVVPNTPGYASPEQLVRDETGTAVDIYALGLLLHELCTGRRPFADASPESDALDQRREPPQPSSVDAALPRELDWIVARACAFRPDERYPSVDALAADVQAVLENRPPKARATGPLYRAGKFARRNWAPLSVAAAVVCVITALGIGLLREGERTRAALAETERQRQQAEWSAAFLRDLFADVDATRQGGRMPTALELIDRGRARLADAALDPALQLELAGTLVDVYTNLGAWDRAMDVAEAHRPVAEAQGPAAVAALLERIGRVHLLAGRADSGLATFDAALASPETLPVGVRVDLLHGRGSAQQALGRLAEAGVDFEAAAGLLAAESLPDRERRAENRLRRGSQAWMTGDLEAAREAYAAAVAEWRAAGVADASRLARAVDAHASALYALGRMEEAVAGFEEAVALRSRVLGDAHPLTARSLSHLGAARFELDQLDGARGALQRSLAVYEQAGLSDGPHAAGALNNLGLVERAAGNVDAARSAFERALSINAARFGADHLNVARNRNNLGLVAEDAGELDQALAHYREAERIFIGIQGEQHADRAFSLTNQGRALMLRGEHEPARAVLDEALALREAALGEMHPQVAETLFWAGLADCLLAHSERGRSRLERGRAIRRTGDGDHDPRLDAAVEACSGRAVNPPADSADDPGWTLIRRLDDAGSRLYR